MATIRDRVYTQLLNVAPWRDDVSWKVSTIQVAIALGIGVYLLFASAHAIGTLSQIVGAYLMGVSVLHLTTAVRDPASPAGRPSGLLRRAVGLFGGAAAVLYPWIGVLSASDARIIVTAVLVISGAITIIGALTDRRLAEIRWGIGLGGVVEIAIGVMFFIVTDYDRPLLNLMGITMILTGLILVGRSVWVSGILESIRRDE